MPEGQQFEGMPFGLDPGDLALLQLALQERQVWDTHAGGFDYATDYGDGRGYGLHSLDGDFAGLLPTPASWFPKVEAMLAERRARSPETIARMGELLRLVTPHSGTQEGAS